MTATQTIPSTGTLRGWRLAGWLLMMALAVFPALSAMLDLLADARTRLPADHSGTFTTLAGSSFAQVRATAPGIARYITLLERGYAVHELTFALLLTVIIAVPFRQGHRWALWAIWLALIADLGYTLTFGVYDHAILARALIVDFALPALLLAHLPVFFTRPRTAGAATR